MPSVGGYSFCFKHMPPVPKVSVHSAERSYRLHAACNLETIRQKLLDKDR